MYSNSKGIHGDSGHVLGHFPLIGVFGRTSPAPSRPSYNGILNRIFNLFICCILYINIRKYYGT